MATTAIPRLDADHLLEFYQRAGFRVYRGQRSHWYEAGPRFLLAVPTHLPLRLAAAEATVIMRTAKVLGLRYVSAQPEFGAPSWRMVLEHGDYGLEGLSANTRSKIRRGLKQNTVRRIRGMDLKKYGEHAFIDTVGRQGRSGRYGLERWHRLLDAADATPGIEIWSAWHGDELSSYLLIMVFDDVCEFYEARSRNALLRFYPNNALIFSVAQTVLRDYGVARITFGIEGLEELDSLDQFKLAMGFSRQPIVQHVVFRSALKMGLALPPLRAAVSRIASRPQAGSFWRRAGALLRFSDLAPS